MPIDIKTIATRHSFSSEAVTAAWHALRNSGGGMAQFSHPDLGGNGQWMPGMLMIGDMFNSALKARVDSLFHELARQPVEPPSQAASRQAASLSYGRPNNSWYPPELGFPSSAGSQNNVRYAYFPETHRLAIELFGRVTIYDTGTHQITGVQQGQSNDAGSMTFTSQYGVIPVSSLRVV